jgi:hypothetical protein
MKNQELSLVKNIFDVDYLMNNFALGKLHFFINDLKYLRTLYKRDIESFQKSIKVNSLEETKEFIKEEIDSLNKELHILNINIVNVEVAMKLGERKVIQFTKKSGFVLYLN